MRISADRHDPGYRLFRRVPASVHAVVLLDGEVQKRVVTADTKRGLVVQYDDTVNWKRNKMRRRVLHGTVDIQFERRA